MWTSHVIRGCSLSLTVSHPILPASLWERLWRRVKSLFHHSWCIKNSKVGYQELLVLRGYDLLSLIRRVLSHFLYKGSLRVTESLHGIGRVTGIKRKNGNGKERGKNGKGNIPDIVPCAIANIKIFTATWLFSLKEAKECCLLYTQRTCLTRSFQGRL